MVESEAQEPGDRRAQTTDRRTYNRRSAPAVTPPYYEAFERIAVAIEGIGALLDQRQVRLPDAGGSERRSAVTPRTSPEQRR